MTPTPLPIAVDAAAVVAEVAVDVAETAMAADAAEDGTVTVAGAVVVTGEVEAVHKAKTKAATEKAVTRSAARTAVASAAVEVEANKAVSRVEANPKVDHGRVQ